MPWSPGEEKKRRGEGPCSKARGKREKKTPSLDPPMPQEKGKGNDTLSPKRGKKKKEAVLHHA